MQIALWQCMLAAPLCACLSRHLLFIVNVSKLGIRFAVRRKNRHFKL